jgi:hypothetical protein
MAIDPKDIEAGKCFITAGEQVRRVLGTRGADVFYEVRSRNAGGPPWGPKKTVSIANFAATVEREVTCEVAPAEEQSAAPPTHPEAPTADDPVGGDPILATRSLIDRALSANSREDRLGHLYAAADLLVQAIETLERRSEQG